MAGGNNPLKPWEKQVQTSLSPKYLTLINIVSEVEEVSKSRLIRDIVKQYFDNMPPSEIERITSSSNHY